MASPCLEIIILLVSTNVIVSANNSQEPEPRVTGYGENIHCEERYQKVVFIGSSVNRPGKSCLDILNKGGSFGDGEYWIKPLNEGAPFIAHCDMTTDNGGWTLVTSLVLHSNHPFTWSLSSDYKDIERYKSDKLAISDVALKALRQTMGFNQLRFHCFKKNPGRTFHIMTKKNSHLGESVVKYFSGYTNVLPASCGSFDVVPGDNSRLSQECSKWGYSDKKQYFVGLWSHYGGDNHLRLFNHVAFVGRKYHWIVPSGAGRWECDDYVQPVLSPGDFWKIYVR